MLQHARDLDVDGAIILISILEVRRGAMDLIELAQEGFCEHGNELSGFMQREIIQQMSDRQFLNNLTS
jgi:hypothetical protein